MTAIMICLGDKREDETAGVLKLLNVLLSTETEPEDKCQILEENFQIKMTQKLESEVSLMCNLSKGVEEKGIEKGKIYGAVAAYRDVQLSDEMIIKKLQEKFQLSEESARDYLK